MRQRVATPHTLCAVCKLASQSETGQEEEEVIGEGVIASVCFAHSDKIMNLRVKGPLFQLNLYAYCISTCYKQICYGIC